MNTSLQAGKVRQHCIVSSVASSLVLACHWLGCVVCAAVVVMTKFWGHENILACRYHPEMYSGGEVAKVRRWADGRSAGHHQHTGRAACSSTPTACYQRCMQQDMAVKKQSLACLSL